MVKKVIIDCDAGMDDASALFLAAKAHKAGIVDLVAITTVHGNTSLYEKETYFCHSKFILISLVS